MSPAVLQRMVSRLPVPGVVTRRRGSPPSSTMSRSGSVTSLRRRALRARWPASPATADLIPPRSVGNRLDPTMTGATHAFGVHADDRLLVVGHDGPLMSTERVRLLADLHAPRARSSR